MDLAVIDTLAGLEDVADEWAQVHAGDPDATHSTSPRFVTAWWRAFADRPEVDLHVVTVRNNNRLVGVAPFCIRHEGSDGCRRVLRFAATGDAFTVLVDHDAQVNPATVHKEVLRHVESAAGWHRVFLTNIPTGTSLAHRLLTSPSHNRHFQPYLENPWIPLDEHADFAAFEREWVPKSARQYRNKLLREHEVTFRAVHGTDADLLRRMANLHGAEKRWLTKVEGRSGRRSLFEDAARYEHIERLFTTSDDNVTFLYEDDAGALVGYRTCWLDGRRLLSWNSAYNPDYHDYRVGKAIQYDILAHLFEHDIADVFDFGAGRYPWKFEWTDRFTATYGLKLHLRDPDDAVGGAEDDHGGHGDEEGGQEESDRDDHGAEQDTADDEGTTDEDAAADEGVTAPPDVQSSSWDVAVARATRAARIVRAGDWRAAAKAVLRTPASRRRAVALRDRAGDVAATLRAKFAVLPGPSATAVGQAEGTPGDRADPATTIWYVPHPDDEALYMAGSIVDDPAATKVVVLLTRGGGSRSIDHVNERLDGELDVASFTDARLKEFRMSLSALGIEPRHVVVHDLPDGDLDEDVVHDIVRAMAVVHPGARHVTMSPHDPHDDHAAAGRALARAHRKGVVSEVVFHLPVPLADGGTMVDLSDRALAAKRAAIRAYTQWEPDRGLYAIARHSVPRIVDHQLSTPTERIHGTGST